MTWLELITTMMSLKVSAVTSSNNCFLKPDSKPLKMTKKARVVHHIVTHINLSLWSQCHLSTPKNPWVWVVLLNL